MAARAQPVYTENAGGTGGTLSIGSGSTRSALPLSGDYEGSLFHAGGDGHGGTAITYGPAQAQAADLLAIAHS